MRELHRPDESFGKLFPAQIPRSGIFYVPSQFLLPFSHCGRQYLFNTLTKQCVESVLPSTAIAGGEYEELIKARFLVPEGIDEYAFYRSLLTLRKLHDRKNLKPAYTILPTLGCNARCTYCVEEGMKPIGMTSETVEDTLRFILNDCGEKKITLSWYGGEPLLRQDVIDLISGGVRVAGVDYKGIMVTNGSLITPETIEKMTDLWRLERVQISMDGAERDYIARKRYLRYHDEYHNVIEASDRISEAGIAVQIRCNVDENNLGGVTQLLDDLSAGIRHKQNVSFYLAPLHQVMWGKYGVAVCEKILALQDAIRDAGFTLLFERFNHVMPTYHCMADAEGIVIGPDGGLYCCDDLLDSAWIGTVKDGITKPDARAAFIGADRIPEKCKACMFLPDCIPVMECPNSGMLCTEARTLFTLDTLRRIIDNNETPNI